ncbi:VanW family protein [Paenibacillus hexagrammi]|uniref:VanW family protein n=1 Tax=Paenibacillus hexagrammi TaxID=2908839 RepID=A0ABY3SKP9_9BACL|nr:VanW family protein [Paenibacillus sp. YPD9-1]UJF34048.1 VanW family protein [Paenibacillus sp. YPD9-1]
MIKVGETMLAWKAWLGRMFPFLYHVRIWQLQMARRWRDSRAGLRFASLQSEARYPYLCKKHKSVLRRRLAGTDPQLQENKIVNLRLSLPLVHGIVIRPGETFSFWNRIGKVTAARGFLDGLVLSRGEVTSGTGGGLCQLANMLFWLALHSPLTIAERHHHSFDMFPDDRRTVPFGSGTSVFYNYVDLRIYNGTNTSYQIQLQLTDDFLVGELYRETLPEASYRVEERGHRFFETKGRWYRQNEIWRLTVQPSGSIMKEEKIIDNLAEVKYALRAVNSE